MLGQTGSRWPLPTTLGRGSGTRVLIGSGSWATLELVGLAAVIPVIAWAIAAALRPADLYNDFHSYWYAGRLLAHGSSPYDLDSLRALAAREGDRFLVGTGFSYPLPFAFLMLPLAGLPFDTAVALFDGVSIAVFGCGVALWLRHFHADASRERRRLVALLAGGMPPVVGSVLVGQANLLVMASVAAGAAILVDRPSGRQAIGGAAIGLAAVVKLVPGALILPLGLARRRLAVAGLAAGALIPLVLATLARPAAAADTLKLAALFEPDPFVTNQSLNGLISRFVVSSDRMTALAPGAFHPLLPVATATLAFGAFSAVVLWGARRRLEEPAGLALGLAFMLVAATIGAPKTSFWNESLVLVAGGLLLATASPTLDLGGLGQLGRGLLLCWGATIAIQPLVWLIPRQPEGAAVGLVVVAGSLSIYGNLALLGLLAGRLLAGGKGPGAAPAPEAAESLRR